MALMITRKFSDSILELNESEKEMFSLNHIFEPEFHQDIYVRPCIETQKMEGSFQIGEKEYLNNALLHICAYVKMGLSYERQQELFDPILELIDRKSFSRLKIIQNMTMKQVGLTKTQIRGMIGRWMPSASNPKKIGDVVDDIIEKVKVREQGIHTYAYKRGNIEYIYELVISEEQCFFHDVRQRKNYFFEVPEK